MKKNIWLDGMMGLIVADALGVPVQFMSRDEIKNRAKGPVTGMEAGGVYNMPEGTWSDDSSMALAILASLKEEKNVDPADIMTRFAEWEINGEYTPFGVAFDQGLTCSSAIYRFAEGHDVRTCGATGEHANGNGALMRILPACLYYHGKQLGAGVSDEEAIEGIHAIGALTHNHLRSNMCCGFYYFMVRSMINRFFAEGAIGGAFELNATGGAAEKSAIGGAAEKSATGGAADKSATGGAADKSATGGAADKSATGGAADKSATGGAAELRSEAALGNEMAENRATGNLLIDILQDGINEGLKFYGKDDSNLEEMAHLGRLFNLSELRDTTESEIRSSGYVIDSIEAAVWCLITTNSYKDCMLKAVNLGDDTDTVAAIAGGLAGLYYGYEEIPAEWLAVIKRREWIEEMCRGM